MWNAVSASDCLFGHTMFPRNASTISSDSHSVPEPFRSTSSALMGMMVHSEKMNMWTYLSYR